MSYRERVVSIRVPMAEPKYAYRLSCSETGEVLEAGELAPLLRKLALYAFREAPVWQLERIAQ